MNLLKMLEKINFINQTTNYKSNETLNKLTIINNFMIVNLN